MDTTKVVADMTYVFQETLMAIARKNYSQTVSVLL